MSSYSRFAGYGFGNSYIRNLTAPKANFFSCSRLHPFPPRGIFECHVHGASLRPPPQPTCGKCGSFATSIGFRQRRILWAILRRSIGGRSPKMRFSLFSCLLLAVAGTVPGGLSSSAWGQVPIHLQPSQAMPYGLQAIDGDYGWRANATPNPLLDKLQCSEGADRAWVGYQQQRQAYLSHMNRHSLCPATGCGVGARATAANCGSKACDVRASVWAGSLTCQEVPGCHHGGDRSFQPSLSSAPAPSVLGSSPAASPPNADVPAIGTQPLASPPAATPADLAPSQPTATHKEEKRSSFGTAIRDWFNSDPAGNR
jgi:hypothetical protein